MSGKKILIVEDDTRVREMLYEYLSRLGYTVSTAPGGKEAVEMIGNSFPDLVLLDYKMPGMNGGEVLKDLKARDLKPRVVLMTGMDNPDIEKEAREYGAAGFLRKQLELPDLARSIDAMLKERDAENEAARKVLVVDDNEQIRSLLDRFLRKKGFFPLLAPDGEGALEVIKRARPSLVLLDINLPGMDGLMTLKKIRETDPAIGVIMITGNKQDDIAQEAMRLGAYDYIIKPFDLDYLEMCLLTKISLLTA